MTPEYEFRSQKVNIEDWHTEDIIQKTCNEWAAEGFIVFSIVCPQPSNYHTFRLTAKRRLVTDNELRHRTTGRRFR
jgi:hypothetical protein